MIEGGCLCGAVRYEVSGKAFDVTHCHCSDCRRASGAPFVTWASFRSADVRFVKGEPRVFPWAGRLRSFCPECGSALTFMTGPEAEETGVTVCTFDHPEAVSPEDHTWVQDRLPWIRLGDDLPSFAKDRPR